MADDRTPEQIFEKWDARAVDAVLPEGHRLWKPADADVPDPVLARAAYTGPVGRYLDLLEGETEAHPAAVGIQVLAMVGTVIGRDAEYRAGNIVQHCNVFAAIVGPSSEGAKTIADTDALVLVEEAVPFFLARHGAGGLGSGEVLIHELADDRDPPAERRRIIHDAELSTVLRVVRRDGSILGDVIRKAFDYGPLRHSTLKTEKPVIATGHHVAVVGSITPSDHRALVDDIALANGFANRFLYVWSRLTCRLPNGGEIDQAESARVAADIADAIAKLRVQVDANRARPQWYRLDPEATEAWEAFYRERRTGVGHGLAKALSARQVAQASRLALIYAVLDAEPVIRRRHVDAAIAWCDYSLGSIDKVLDGAQVGAKAGKLLEAVRTAMPHGITGGELYRGVAHNWHGGELTVARAELEAAQLIVVISEPSAGGRPYERYLALSPPQEEVSK